MADLAKAIIIAAGRGKRLGTLTENLPKCLLEVRGKTILQHQLDAYRACGVRDISVIRGYCAGKIDLPGLKYFFNDDYANNNILNSLMYAEPAMDAAFVASYSDIVFGEETVRAVLANEDDIAVVGDYDWLKAYDGRDEHPVSEAEKIVADPDGAVREIGKVLLSGQEATCEFIGMIKCSAAGAAIFKEYFHRARAEFEGRSYYRARTFARAYLTDFVQYLIEQGVPVRCIGIRGGWHEIDVRGDLLRAGADQATTRSS